MQSYYFYRHQDTGILSVSQHVSQQNHPDFVWIDCFREDVVNAVDLWQEHIKNQAQLVVNEFHIADILNIEHPCGFDTMEEYDFLTFRKIMTPDDQHILENQSNEQHQSEFGLFTTPVNFIITGKYLITVRERGNKSMQNYVDRLSGLLEKNVTEQHRLRRLPNTPLNLALRILNSMIDDYLGLRTPLTRRVEFWQTELLQGKHYFKQWQQLLQENMAFQQVENLCEEQIETLQELRDEAVENHHHLHETPSIDSLDLILVRINDLVSHIERIQKHTSRLRQSIQSAIDLHFSAISNQTNENMRILAIITAIFAPLTLLTGIYGMNFESIPGLKSPEGFWVMLMAMLMTTLLLTFYFYRRHLVGRGEKSVVDMLSQSNQKNVNLFTILNVEPIKKTMKEVEKMAKGVTKT
ncbi:magnesium transporter CorA family protein [Acinetobacter sp. B10A]|uniref:magnesium transporter CorA family protein n=1 Tax=Acinetobacter baretiae TaxID=2605383 RepID=UPI001B3C526A|nr:magnesium transporter CorA family protein [Acinetobacter baretiae]MBF7685089.1 magnesium transporter CorA family protein [Acinetobacter baretiae]